MTVDEKLIPKSIFDEDFGENNIGWASEENIKRLYALDRGTVFVPKSGNLKYIGLARRTRLELIPVDDPKGEFLKSLDQFEPDFKNEYAHHKNGTVFHDSVKQNGDAVLIGSNNSIGFEGFGFHKGKRIPHKGGVLIGSNVEIGSNTCIDRAVIGDTVIGDNVKIDNLVHIAHGVKIGNGSIIVAGAVICGSVTIGENVWVGANACIRQHLTIGDNAVIGMGAVVVKDVPAGQTVAGNPAKQLSK